MDEEKITDDINKLKITRLQQTGLKRNTIDKFYTKSSVVDQCINYIKDTITINKNDIIIEPSAGNGSFINSIKLLSDNYKFYDLEPEHDEIITQDFLELGITNLQKNDNDNNDNNIHVIGNPPFGRQSSLAIKFIKKCCHFANTISFILPKSFKKESMKKSFSKNYHLIFENDLLDNSFLVNNEESNVPCIFQIWQYKVDERKIEIKQLPLQFKFVLKTDKPDISFRRVGVNAGNISTEIDNKSIQSHYFIKIIIEDTIENNLEKLKLIHFNFNNTVGPKSISKPELTNEFNKYLC